MEINGHVEGEHWELVNKRDVPKGMKILDAARLNVHGGQQQHGVHYFDTYAPVVTWASVRMALILSIINCWETRQIDFVM
eukprot:4440384-Ditylum_brightwellii.AAC.1